MRNIELYCLDAAMELVWLCESQIEAAYARGMSTTAIQDTIRTYAYIFAKEFERRIKKEEDLLWDEAIQYHADKLNKALSLLI